MTLAPTFVSGNAVRRRHGSKDNWKDAVWHLAVDLNTVYFHVELDLTSRDSVVNPQACLEGAAQQTSRGLRDSHVLEVNLETPRGVESGTTDSTEFISARERDKCWRHRKRTE